MGPETPVFTLRRVIEKFWEFEIPEEIVQGYGVPPPTGEAKHEIPGGNLLRLHGMEQPTTS